MTQTLNFGTAYIAAVQAVIADLTALRQLQDRIAQDATLIPGYVGSAGARADLSVSDITNANNAVTQLLFTFDSGAPTQKSFLFKLL
jgi:hypothetical protein